jgi:hypothetical protein
MNQTQPRRLQEVPMMHRLFTFACAFSIVTGLAMALAGALGGVATVEGWLMALDPTADLARLGFGISGGLLVGWAVSMLSLRRPLARRVDAHLLGLGLWFVLDSVASVAAGASANVAGNLVFLVLFGAPLLSLRLAERDNPQTVGARA